MVGIYINTLLHPHWTRYSLAKSPSKWWSKRSVCVIDCDSKSLKKVSGVWGFAKGGGAPLGRWPQHPLLRRKPWGGSSLQANGGLFLKINYVWRTILIWFKLDLFAEIRWKMRGVGWWCALRDLSHFEMLLNSQRFVLSILAWDGDLAEKHCFKSTNRFFMLLLCFYYGRFESCKT